MEKFVQPFLLMDGDEIVYEGPRHECISRKNSSNLTIKPNPEFGWIEVPKEDD